MLNLKKSKIFRNVKFSSFLKFFADQFLHLFFCLFENFRLILNFPFFEDLTFEMCKKSYIFKKIHPTRIKGRATIFWSFLGRAIIFLGKNWTGDQF